MSLFEENGSIKCVYNCLFICICVRECVDPWMYTSEV